MVRSGDPHLLSVRNRRGGRSSPRRRRFFHGGRFAKRYVSGASGKKYAVYGAIYSLLAVLPSIWLLLKLRGISPARALIVLGFAFLYFSWLSSSVLFVLLFGVEALGPSFQSEMLVYIALANGVLWGLSVFQAFRLNEANHDDLLDFRRIEPFASFLLCNTAIMGSMFAHGIVTSTTMGEAVVPYWSMLAIIGGWMLVWMVLFSIDTTHYCKVLMRRRAEKREAAMKRAATVAEADRLNRW